MLVIVAVVEVRVVRVFVTHRRVVMSMAMGLAGGVQRTVGVLVMRVVNVAVLVVQGLMLMGV